MTDLSSLNLSPAEAYQAGEAAARADLIPGFRFRGAFGARSDAGLAADTMPGKLFVSGYLRALDIFAPQGVMTDANGFTVGA